MGYIIDKKICVDCGYCKMVCHFGAISEVKIEDKFVFEIDLAKCKSCAECELGCSCSAIYATEDNKLPISVSVITEKCIGCSLCARFCPVNAITGVIKQPYIIDNEKCIKCCVCKEKCKKDAVAVEY